MKEMLEDPEALAEQASKVSEAMQALGDPEKMQELLGGEGGEMMENLQKMLSGNGEGLEGMQEVRGRARVCAPYLPWRARAWGW